MTDSFTTSHRHVIIELAAQHSVPVVYPFRFFAQDGGLLAYGNNRFELFRGAAAYVNRILHGERSHDLPVQPPTQFELVINLGRSQPAPAETRFDTARDPVRTHMRVVSTFGEE